MIAFGHTAVGAAVGLAGYHYFGVENPLLGLVSTGVAGVISHYVTDIIPHGHFFKQKDYKQKIIPLIFYDVLLGVVMFLGATYLRQGFDLRFWYILFGIGGAQLPDVIANLIFIGILPKKGLFKKELTFHENTHWHGKGNNGLILSKWDVWQLSVILLVLYFTYTT